MTAAEKSRLFGQIWALLDSEQPGERQAALDKLLTLRIKMGWPSFGDVLRRIESTITPEQLEAAQAEGARWKQAHDQAAQHNAALVRRNAVLAARIVSLRSALWFSINRKAVTAFGLALALGYGGYRWSSVQAAPDQQTVSAPANSESAALDAGFRDLLGRARWTDGDVSPVVATVRGVEYWILIRGSIDAASHADARGHAIERHCLQLYASEAARDAGAFITPQPYVALGWWIKWPQRAAECRMPGRSNYS